MKKTVKKQIRSYNRNVVSATSSILENLENRMMMSTVTAWNFDSLTVATSPAVLSPAASTGTGTALTVGLQTGSTNVNSPGGTYAYPNPNASGTGDISDILNGTGNNPSGNQADHSSTGATSGSNATGTNPAWRIRGSSDGWSDNAAVGSQGAQFMASTSGASGISLSFDLDPSSASAPAEVAVQYTTDGGTTWTEAPTLSLANYSTAVGTTDGVSIATNSSDPNVVSGQYFLIANSTTVPNALYWQNGLSASFPSSADNKSGFGVRIVNAATGASEFEVGGTAYPTAGAGNWRLDNVVISATGAATVAPSVTTNPANKTVAAGQPVTFTAAASGNPAPTVQWYQGTYPTGTAISGANASSYTFTTSTTASDNGTSYYAVFTNTAGSANTSSATLTDTLAAPVVTTQPSAASVNGGTTASFTAVATGSPLPTVQWQSSPNNSTWSNVSGGVSTNTSTSVSSTYSFQAALTQSGTYYRAVFINSQNAAGVASSGAQLTVTGSTLAGWTFPTVIAAPYNNPPAASGVYQTSASAISLGMTNTYSVPSVTNASSVTNDDVTANPVSGVTENAWRIRGTYSGSGSTGTTANINGWNTAAPQYSQGVEFDTSTVGYNNIFVVFDWEATSKGVANLQEQYNLNTSNPSGWTNINSALSINGSSFSTGNTINLSAITGANNDATFGVRLVSAYNTAGGTYVQASAQTTAINNTSGNWGFNNISIIGSQIPVAPAITTQPTAQTVTVGNPVTFTAAASGYPAPTVQWYSGNTSNPTLIAGANSSSYTFTPTSAQNGNTYFAVFTNSQGTATTNVVGLTVNSAPTITTQPTGLNVSAGATATFSAAATGFPAPTVQWQSSVDGVNFSNISGATSANYSTTASTANAGLYYRAIFTNTAGSATTNVVSLDVIFAPLAQWIFTSSQSAANGGAGQTGGSDASLINTENGTPDAPYATFTYNPFNTSTNVGDIAQTLGLFNDYQGTPVYSGTDIFNTNAVSTVNPNFAPYAWRLRSGHTITGWSQLAPELTSNTVGGNTYDPEGVLFRVNTTGMTDITLNFDWQGGGVADMQPQYSPDGGSTWINAGSILQNFSKDYPGITATTTPPGYYVSLEGSAYPAAGQPNSPFNNPNFELRLVAAYDPNLPLISDGNVIEPLAVHGQYADASAGAQNAVQVLDIGGLPTQGANYFNVSGGTYQLSFGGMVTAPIAYNASPATVAADLNALSTINGAVSVADYLITPFTGASANDDFLGITFSGALGHQAVPDITVVNNTLTGSAPTATVTTWIPGAAAAGVDANGHEVGVTRYVDGGSGWELSNFSFGAVVASGAPSILTNPANTTVVGGTAVTFKAVDYSEVSPVTAQWQINTGSGWSNITTGGTNISGNTSTYTFTTNTNLSDNGHLFRVIFTNANGSTTSAAATLTTVTPVAVTITKQPFANATQVGFIANFTAAATGTPSPTVQWQVSSGSGWTNLTTDGINVFGATTTTLSIRALSSQVGLPYQYRAVFTNVLGPVATNPASFTSLSPETTVVGWNFANSPTGATNNPAPTTGSGTLSGLGMSIPFDYAGQADGASGYAAGGPNGPNGTINFDDITSSQVGLANPAFTEPLFRVRGGPNIANLTVSTAGAPGNGWSNFAKEYTQGLGVSASTVGYGSIYITMDWYATKSSELNARQQYTLDGGATWYNLDDQQLAYNGSTNPSTGLDNLDPNDPYAPLNAPADDYYGATAVYATTTISSVSLTNNVATIVANQSYVVGQTVNIRGVSNALFNGIFTITAATSSSFSYALTGANVASTAQTGASASLGGYIVPLVFNLTGIAGVANNPNFGVRLVNAYNPSLPLISSTLIGDSSATMHGQYAIASSVASPTPYPGAAGNWRFDNIVVHGVSLTPTWYNPGSSTYTWNGLTQTLTVTAGTGTIVSDPLGTNSPIIVVSGSGTSLLVDSTAHVASLNISGGASVTVNNNGSTSTLVVAAGSNTFAIDSSSSLDIKSGFLDLQAANASAGAALLASVKGLISFPTGSTGIISSTSLGILGAVGSIENAGQYGTGGSISTTFGGVTPGANDVLVRETYVGDTNLDGQVNSVDYTAIDNGYLSHLTGWSNGDLNGDGVINGSDYTLIDNAFNTQGTQLSPAAQISTPASVFAGGNSSAVVPTTQFASLSSIADLLKKDQANIVSNSQDVVDALNG